MFFITASVRPCVMQPMFINIFFVGFFLFCTAHSAFLVSLCVLSPKTFTTAPPSLHDTFLYNLLIVAAAYLHISGSVLSFTYADDVHEAVHAVADLEEQVLTLPLGRGAEGGPDEPGDAGDEEKGTQNDGRYLHLLYDRQRDRLPLEGRKTSKSAPEEEELVKVQIQQSEDTRVKVLQFRFILVTFLQTSCLSCLV